jgi:hypothetical protein
VNSSEKKAEAPLDSTKLVLVSENDSKAVYKKRGKSLQVKLNNINRAIVERVVYKKKSTLAASIGHLTRGDEIIFEGVDQRKYIVVQLVLIKKSSRISAILREIESGEMMMYEEIINHNK